MQSAPESALPWADYMRLLSRSKIGVSVRGLGYDTYRYWEIPYAGALLLEQAGYEQRELGTDRKTLVARLYARRHLADHGPLRGIDEPRAEELERFKDL